METVCEARVKVHHAASKFYFDEWVRDGYPQDSHNAIKESTGVGQVQEDPNPDLDKPITSEEEFIRVAVLLVSLPGR